jgi:hypothetical protein
MNEQENYIIENYPSQGSSYCADHLDISIKDVRNYIKILKRKGIDIYINREKRSNIQKHNAQRRDYNATNKVDANLFIHPSEYQTYVLGFLWADGYFNNKSQTYRICLEILEKDMEEIQYIFQGWGLFTRHRKNRQPQKSAICNNKILFEYLEDLGYLNRSEGNKKCVSNISQDKLHIWLRGYFDGDGCFYYNNNHYTYQVIFSSCYEQNWEFMMYILDKYNIKYNIRRTKSRNGNSSQLRITKKNECEKFFKVIYPDHYTFGLSRKYQRLNEVFPLHMKCLLSST